MYDGRGAGSMGGRGAVGGQRHHDHDHSGDGQQRAGRCRDARAEAGLLQLGVDHRPEPGKPRLRTVKLTIPIAHKTGRYIPAGDRRSLSPANAATER